MVIHYQPERLRYNSDRPTAIANVLVATSGSSSRTGDIALGTPTCSARSRQGRWALYPNGDQVVVLWPGGALAGPPAEVARELDRLGDGHDDLDRAAVRAIRQFLTDPAAQDSAVWSSTRARTWSTPGGGLLAQRPHQPARLRRPDASQLARRTLISATSTDSAARPQPRASPTTGRLTAQPSRHPPTGTRHVDGWRDSLVRSVRSVRVLALVRGVACAERWQVGQ